MLRLLKFTKLSPEFPNIVEPVFVSSPAIDQRKQDEPKLSCPDTNHTPKGDEHGDHVCHNELHFGVSICQ